MCLISLMCKGWKIQLSQGNFCILLAQNLFFNLDRFKGRSVLEQLWPSTPACTVVRVGKQLLVKTNSESSLAMGGPVQLLSFLNILEWILYIWFASEIWKCSTGTEIFYISVINVTFIPLISLLMLCSEDNLKWRSDTSYYTV